FSGKHQQHRGSNAAATFVLNHMQATFFLLASCPSARSLVLTIGDCFGARPAAYARAAAIMKWIVRNIVLHDEGPNFALGPIEKRTDLDEAKLVIPVEYWSWRSMLGLVAADRAEPSIEICNHATQWLDLSIMAATIRMKAEEWSAMQILVLSHRKFRLHQLHLDCIPLANSLA